MKNETTAMLWRERMSACKDSGLSVSEFCSQNGLHIRGYYYWRKRLATTVASETVPTSSKSSAVSRSKSGRKNDSPTWLCVEPDTTLPIPQAPSIVIKISGAEIEVGTDFNPLLLRSVVLALGVQPC